MDLDEKIAKVILERVTQITLEQNLDENAIKDAIRAAAKAVYTDGLKESSKLIASHLKQQIPDMLAQDRELQAGFEERLWTRWNSALQLFDAIVILTREAGELFYRKHFEQAAKNQDPLFTALTRIHMRACQTAAAIGVLLKSGFARDALARQRTLHELAIVAFFLKEHSVLLAERFLLHADVETCVAAEQYEADYIRLGCAPPDTANLAKLRARRDELCQRFGKAFKNDYGWAEPVLHKEKPTVRDIELAVRLDHLRSYYRLAGYGIHANAKGMLFDIGDPNVNSNVPGGFLAGASNAGLADPGQLTLISLLQCTTVLLTTNNSADSLTYLYVLQSFTDEANHAFADIDRELKREEELIAKSQESHGE